MSVFDDIFGRQTVKTLTAKDFQLNDDPPITLRYDDCILVLIHGDNSESVNLAKVFSYAAANSIGPVFAHINILREKEVSEAFMRLHGSPGAYNRFTLEGYPTIMAYQNTKPVGFYNGERDAQAIVDYAYTLACRPGYFEPEQLSKSVHIDQSIEMGGFVQSPTFSTSTQFTAANPINRYNPTTGVVVTGSRAALAEQQQAALAEQQQGAANIAQGIPPGQLTSGSLVPTAATIPVAAPVPTTSGLGVPVNVG